MRREGSVGEKLLVVNADDFGMAVSISDGILDCVRAGVVTQASAMAPAPDVERATALAKSAGLPLGVHLTLICEWERYRWGPLTAAGELRAPDGAFPGNLAELRAHASASVVMTELEAQVERLRQLGVEPTHFDWHIGAYDPEITRRLLCRWPSLVTREQVDGRPHHFDSVWHLSVMPLDRKTQLLEQHVRTLPPGAHLVVCHPARSDPELDDFCPVSSKRWKWARLIRVTDVEALLSPGWRGACDQAGVRLVTVSQLPRRDPMESQEG